MNKKNFIWGLITLIVETIITYFIAEKFSVRFIEVMFFVGLAAVVGFVFFTSSGGSLSNFSTATNSARTGMIKNREEFTFKGSPAFYFSLGYMFIGLVFFVLLVTSVIPNVQ